MATQYESIIRLRRDNDFNYAKIADKFIPANGEICLVDTAREGLQVICGDGITPFGNLSYLGGYLVKGYYRDGVFYSGLDYATELEPSERKLFIDLATNKAYQYNGVAYMLLGGETGLLPTATAEIPGIMKLYDTLGDNTDGTMTQKAITDELDDKVEITLNIEEELLIFTT